MEMEVDTIMRAVQRADSNPGLIGDCSRSHALPLISGKHQDLKSISPSTVADLISGRYGEEISKFTIVDCRYPYEFEGGHIQGATNLYTREAILERFFLEGPTNQENLEPMSIDFDSVDASCSKREIIVFHCEFSSERGPGLLRFLRKKDRDVNQSNYPRLHHPEIYVMNEGYKAFYESYSDLCEPQAYVKMKADKEACRHFRAKSKSWHNETKFSRGALKF